MADSKINQIEARGRNGWFHAAQAEVFFFDSAGEVAISICSRQSGKMAPIYLKAKKEKILALLVSLEIAIKNRPAIGTCHTEIKI